jgi:uncharacterized protein YbjT (DUF2867 family)
MALHPLAVCRVGRDYMRQADEKLFLGSIKVKTKVIRRPLVAITGATGYIGGRLLKYLDRREYRLRCIARRPEYLADRLDSDIEVVHGDAADRSSMTEALSGAHTAYYLIHSLGETGNFAEHEAKVARNFADAAEKCRLKRIIYLGGLGDPNQPLSSHLQSRQNVGKILRGSGVQVIEFQASIVIGSGSISFEMIRALTERLPIMLIPKWVSMPAQPIATEDLLLYLAQALELETEGNRIFQIGGTDVVSYGGLMREYARQRGLKRLMIPVPVLTPWLSSLWLTIFTPIYQRIGRKLVMSLRHPTVVTDDSARRLFQIKTMSVRDAIAFALRNEDREISETRWSDALSSAGIQRDWGGVRLGNRIVESQTILIQSKPKRVFEVLQRIGGDTGWYYADGLWQLRGALDIMVGGVGMRRGRRDPEKMMVGDVIDCWRLEQIIPHSLIRLIAEMKLPGRAWLEFELKEEDEKTLLRQTIVFDPFGLFGLVYWYALYPLHKLIFKGMLRNIAKISGKSLSGTSHSFP